MDVQCSTNMVTRPSAARRELDGPVLDCLAEASTPGIAALDARWAAAVLAGHAADAAELRGWLRMVGLLAAVPHWTGGAST